MRRAGTRLQDVDLGVLMVDDLLTRTDRASMAHSLEVRVPFLDSGRVVVSPLDCPRHSRSRRFQKKRLLRQAVAPLDTQRRSSAEANVASRFRQRRWLRGELEPFARDVLASSNTTLDMASSSPRPRSRRVLDPTRERPGRSEPPALGSDLVHALGRLARERHRTTWARPHSEAQLAGAGLDRHDRARARPRVPAADDTTRRAGGVRSR